MPTPGEFNARVRFDRRGPDDNGDLIGPFVPVFETMAKADYLRGSEAAVASRIERRQPVTLIVHDEPRTMAVTTGWRAVVIEGRGVRPGEEINITSVAPAKELGFTNVLGVIGGAAG